MLQSKLRSNILKNASKHKNLIVQHPFLCNHHIGRRKFAVFLKKNKVNRSATLEWWINEISNGFPRSKILLRGAIITKHMIWNPITNKRVPMSVSILCGHLSFMALAISYTESDVLSLRLYAATGVTFAMIFQYYRPEPLYLPFKWNALFLLINALMIGRLLKHEMDSRSIPDEQKQLYVNVFQVKGMHPVEFMELMGIAKRREFLKDDVLVRQGEVRKSLHLIVQGAAKVLRDNEQINGLERHSFVGEMSFLAWEAKQRQIAKRKQSASNTDPLQRKNALFQTQQEQLLEYMASMIRRLDEELVGMGMDDEDLSSSSSSSSTNQDGTDYLGLNEFSIDIHHHDDLELYENDTDKDGSVENLLNIEVPKEAAMELGGANEKMIGSASVVCTEPCIVYSFSFPTLGRLLKRSPTMQVALERVLSMDLNRKLLSSVESGPENRYRRIMKQFLIEQITPTPTTSPTLISTSTSSNNHTDNKGRRVDELSKKDIRFLERYRTEAEIDESVRTKILTKYNWTEEQFFRGWKIDDPALNKAATGYRKELERIIMLAKRPASEVTSRSTFSLWFGSKIASSPTSTSVPSVGTDVVLRGVTSEDRKRLRRIREEHGISYSLHLKLLEELGWEAQDWDAGIRAAYHTQNIDSPSERNETDDNRKSNLSMTKSKSFSGSIRDDAVDSDNTNNIKAKRETLYSVKEKT